jgi:DNA (cytosine-5)-methyltransferase 1
MARPILLDLYCGAGGASVGLHRAGFDVRGVDIEAQPRYPFAFTRGDSLDAALCGVSAVWASPPCQRFSGATPDANRGGHPDHIEAIRTKLRAAGVPWVIENVISAPLRPPIVVLRGDMFELGVIRRRAFESNCVLMAPQTPRPAPRLGGSYVCVVGRGMNRSRRGPPSTWTRPYATDLPAWSRAMGIDWMTRAELVQAVPPAYAEYVGRQLLRYAVLPDGEG